MAAVQNHASMTSSSAAPVEKSQQRQQQLMNHRLSHGDDGAQEVLIDLTESSRNGHQQKGGHGDGDSSSFSESTNSETTTTGDTVIIEDGGSDGHHRMMTHQSKQRPNLTGGPKDSGIDMSMSTSCHQLNINSNDQDEEEAIDLALIEMGDDEGSWLYTAPGVKKTKEDTLAWLRKDIDKLDLRTRRALATKLEQLLRNNSNSPEQVKINNSSVQEQENVPKMAKGGRNYGKTYKVNKQAVRAQLQTDGTVCGTERVSVPPVRKLSASENRKTSAADIPPNFATNDSAVSEKSAGFAEKSAVAEKSATTAKPFAFLQSPASGDYADIDQLRLLASKQEQDLRNCLQQTQLSQQARRKISAEAFSSHDENMSVPVVNKQISPNSTANQFHNAPPQSTIAHSKDAQNQLASSGRPPPPRKSHSAISTINPKSPSVAMETPNSKIIINNDVIVQQTANLYKKHSYGADSGQNGQPIGMMHGHNLAATLISAQKDNGLQKSMPNLADNLLLLQQNEMSTSISEKGSYNDIALSNSNYGLVPSASSHAVSNTLPIVRTAQQHQIGSSSSRLPTPARSKLPKPSGIRGVDSSASKLSAPGGKYAMSNVSSTPKSSFCQKPDLRMDESWKEGCI